MNFGKRMMVSPAFFLMLLALTILMLLPSLILPFWVIKFKGIEQKMELIYDNTSHQIISEIGKRAELLPAMNTSASNLARVVNSSLYGVNISFGAIQDRVSPILFQAISTIPLVSQVSYTGVENLFFSYQYKDNQLLAVYTNSSQFANMSFTQHVNLDNGKLYGEATGLPGITRQENVQDFIFNQTADVAGKGSISLVFPVKNVGMFFSGMELYGGYFCLVTREGKVILEGDSNTCLVYEGYVGNLTCDGKASGGLTVKIRGINYHVFCSTIDIFGVQSVYILALPLTEKFIHRNAIIALILAILTPIMMIITFLAFFFIIWRSSKREMYLCSALIKQKEATQQAERKNLNKSLAFANISHDVRTSLANISGLAEMSQEGIEPKSLLGTYLKDIKDCTNYLMDLLNSILDTSKIEAGKMQLEDVEFDVAQLVEDVVDLNYPVKKGVDVILDPQDESIFSKYSKVKGDRTKLRQILTNLISNAIKFTEEGHVVVRVWVRKPSLKTPLFSSIRHRRSFGLSSCLPFWKNEEIYDEQSGSRFTIQDNSDSLEFVFEVEDTGPGIEKDKRNSIFENYVQVKKKDEPEKQQGTGLGLAIVQSLVRLMGGEIKIKDKKDGEKGSCFRFNIFLVRSESSHTNETRREDDLESKEEYSSRSSCSYSGPRPSAFSPKQERSRVVLFIQGEKRRKIIQNFMERVGVEVSIVNEWQQLSHTLNKVKKEMRRYKFSTSSVSDLSLSSEGKSAPLSSMDGADEMPIYLYGRANKVKNVSNFVLIIIDTSGGPFIEFSKAVGEFRKGLGNTCYRIVWIDKEGTQNMMNSKGLNEDDLPLTDSVISKPFHGSRLFCVLSLLPEFGGSKRRKSRKSQGKDLPSSSRYPEIEEGCPVSKSKGKEILSPKIPTKDEILSGKKILLVEDNVLQTKIASNTISKLGAILKTCENGEEAVQLVSKGLSDRRKHRASTSSLPYDYIFMDCEMPVMDGFEATRRIREEEGYYGGEVRIPIIALTAHTTGEEATRMMQNGIDFFLTKPLNKDQLIETIMSIDSRTS